MGARSGLRKHGGLGPVVLADELAQRHKYELEQNGMEAVFPGQEGWDTVSQPNGASVANGILVFSSRAVLNVGMLSQPESRGTGESR